MDFKPNAMVPIMTPPTEYLAEYTSDTYLEYVPSRNACVEASWNIISAKNMIREMQTMLRADMYMGRRIMRKIPHVSVAISAGYAIMPNTPRTIEKTASLTTLSMGGITMHNNKNNDAIISDTPSTS